MPSKNFKSKKELQKMLAEAMRSNEELKVAMQLNSESMKNVLACVWKGRFNDRNDRMLDDENLTVIHSIDIPSATLLDVYKTTKVEIKQAEDGLLIELSSIPKAADPVVEEEEPKIIPFSDAPTDPEEADQNEE